MRPRDAFQNRLKPMFHQNMFMLGRRVGSDSQRKHFILASKKPRVPKANPKSSIGHNAYTLPALCPTQAATRAGSTRHLGPCWTCQFHVFCHLSVSIGYPTRTQFLVEYGLHTVQNSGLEIKMFFCTPKIL